MTPDAGRATAPPGTAAVASPAAGIGGAAWSDGVVATPAGVVPRARTRLNLLDRLGTMLVRLGVGRGRYRVPPGLYAVGAPDPRSSVLVSANYKLSFDHLRASLVGRDAWILVLETNGINVWCAAGKGTFGTEELVRRARATRLAEVVTHRTLVLPQLAAPGVAAHLVRRAGFRVVFGPVRASDLPAFLDARLKASPEMRRVRFGLRERAVLVPVEVVLGTRYALLAAAALLLLGGLGPGGWELERLRTLGASSAALLVGTFAVGVSLGFLLLPWLPGRAFSIKGAALGAALLGAFALAVPAAWRPLPWPHLVAWVVWVPALTSFAVMNLTGATPVTSLSGVLREMRFAVPAQVGAAVVGSGFWLTGLFLRGGAAG